MYINRSAEEIFRLAVIALSSKFLDNLGISVKKIATEARVSEKQIHFWKGLLAREGPKIFSSLRPGRRRQSLLAPIEEKKRLLVYETINNLLVQVGKEGGKSGKLSGQLKEAILRERGKIKEECGVNLEEYAKLLGINSSTLRRWQRRYQKEGPAGLTERSRAPKNCPQKATTVIIRKIIGYGRRWQRKHRRIKITEFGDTFRWKYHKLLLRYGKSNLSNKTISRYLKEAGLYREEKEGYEGKRGAYRYYFPGAQFLMDTVVVKFFGIKTKVIGVMDAFSRKVFHQEGILQETAAKVLMCIRTSLSEAERLGIKVLSTLSDHGKSYKAFCLRDHLRKIGIYRVFAHPYHPQGKAAIERYFRTLKEALADRRERILCLATGIWVRIRKVVTLICLNLILTGFTERYQGKRQTCIDGESPLQRLHHKTSRGYQGAVTELLSEQERNSQLKAEYIRDIYEEFGLPKGMKKLLARYPKGSLREAVDILRRKVAVEEMTTKHRAYYLGKVLGNQEKRDREERERRVKKVIWCKEQKAKEEERKQQVEEERRRCDRYPDEFLKKAVEWQIVFWDRTFSRGLYQTMIKEATEKILFRHSRLTAGLKVENLCRKVWEKKELETSSLIKGGLSLPEGEKLKAAKEMITKIIRDTYLEYRTKLPAFQGLTRMWRGT